MDKLFNKLFHEMPVNLCAEPATEIIRFIESLQDSLRNTIQYEVLRKANLVTKLEELGKGQSREKLNFEIQKLKKIRNAWLDFNPQDSVVYKYRNEFTTMNELDDLLDAKSESIFYLEAHIKYFSMYVEMAWPEGNFMTDFHFRENLCSIFNEFKRLIEENNKPFELNKSTVSKFKIVENDHQNYFATAARLTALLYHSFGNQKTEKTVKIWYKKISENKEGYRTLQNFNANIFIENISMAENTVDQNTQKYIDSLSNREIEQILKRIKISIDNRKSSKPI